MSAARARRATVKKVNYSKEQEFSDGDLFEDEEDEAPPPPPTRKRKGRKSKGSSTSVQVPGGLDSIYDDNAFVQDNRPIYTEKGYDPTLPPIRERFSFMPEYEEDGTAKIELIIGRRPIDDSGQDEEGDDSDGDVDEDSQSNQEEKPKTETPRKGRGRPRKDSQKEITPGKKKQNKDSEEKQEAEGGPVIEYEYLIKYKGKSYLHLEWKTGADLESMNKSAKGIYRRYLKKLAQGGDDELENPEFDPAYAIPEKIIDEAEQEMTIEMTDKELLRWEKQREKELALEEANGGGIEAVDNDVKDGNDTPVEEEKKEAGPEEEEKETTREDEDEVDWPDDDKIDFANLPIEKLRAIVNKEDPYFPIVEGCDNPYRDGYVTEPPKKPRASYIFFQCTMRSYYQKKNPQSHLQSELMSALGDAWRNMSDEEKAPFLQLAAEEAKRYEKEKILLEKAQRPNGVWQPLRRCRMVLDRLVSDGFAEIFLEPVNLKDFPDYEEIVDTPMDLGTVRKKLETKKYQAPEQFARDMRKIWNNCKIYNMHGSQIWYVADYMSKQFERLYHAWVLDFRERYLRWADPRARPWEHTCRIHDGKCGTSDDKMVLCDHCDGMYGLACLEPRLKKVPKNPWYCPDCKPKLKSLKGRSMLSAVAENAARKRAELGDLPKKKITQTMYLVKWAGLGYEYCTWETKKDIGNDKLIAEFHKLNKTDSDEPDLTDEMIDKHFTKVKHLNVENSGGISVVPSLRSQLYAQTRAFQFVKFADEIPEKVHPEIGPKTFTVCSCPRVSLGSKISENSSQVEHPREVVECVSDLVLRVSRNMQPRTTRSNTFLPPPLTGEYDAIIPITSKGLMMNVGEIHGSVAFLGYRQFPGGVKGPAEERNLIRNVGDKILSVDGVSTIGMTFKDVIALLRESGKNKFAYMRFLENKYSAAETSLASVGTKGRYAHEELQKKFITDRQQVLVERNNKIEQVEEEDANKENKREEDSDDESDHGSEGSFQPESDDDELMDLVPEKQNEKAEALTPNADADNKLDESQPPDENPAGENGATTIQNQVTVAVSVDESTPQSLSGPAYVNGEDVKEKIPDIETTASMPGIDAGKASSAQTVPEKIPPVPGILTRPETTRSLAFRLLDMDVGYSSDEAGDNDCVYFIDGVDQTFTRMHDLRDMASSAKRKEKDKTDEEEQHNIIPAKQTEFAAQTDRAKLAAAVALSSNPPNSDDFDNFPYPSTRELEEQERLAREAEESVAEAEESPSKSMKRSTVKVEQVSITTGDTIHVWPNVEAAAATLQLPLNQLKQVLRGEYDEDIGDEVGGFKWGYALAGAKVTAGNASTNRGGGGRKAREAWLQFREKLYDPNDPHIYKNKNRLRDYQVDGVNWLASTWYKRSGAILADEMGLGKTVQIVCYCEHLFRAEKIKGPFLIVVPLSTVEHWRREFEGWTDMVCCVYHDRQRVWRDVMREYEWYYEDRPHTHEFLKFDVLVTTYDTLISDFDIISQIPFRVSVVDEAHRLRNQKGKLLECMREVSARGTMQYGFQSRVLMSGTPLQNDLTELWTLLNFIEPFKFADLDSFQAKFGNMANRTQVESLQKMISPFMLRRVKEDVAKDIPAKEETLIDVELTSIQKQYYRAIFEHNHAFLSMGNSRQTAPKLMNIQMELRKVCNHPFLLDGVEHREAERLYKEFMDKGKFEGKTPEEQQHMLNEHGYIMTSGKMVLLDKLLPKLRQEGHKILIFSQMVKMLDLISEYCDFRSFRYERLDGRIRGTERQKAIDRFEREDDSFLFLLSTRAGGVGINLTAADICIIFDSDWNPQNDVQAQARCHRIGQTKDVRIYRLVTSRSFEQEMFERASRKLGLEQAVLGSFEKETDDGKPTQQEMEQLLKKGAYALLEDDNDEITKEFCADDIESILAKRTRTRVVEGAKTASWLNKQGMSVTKSKFTAESGENLDMDDPLFWQKVMPDFVTPSIMLQKLNDLSDEIEGKIRGPGRGRGKGRGRGRPRKSEVDEDMVDKNGGNTPEKDEEKHEEEMKDNTEDHPDDAADMSEDDGDAKLTAAKKQLTRKNIQSVHQFMNDLKGMMENILDEAEEEDLQADEKAACQKLLLTISVKEKIFKEEHRRLAKMFLKRLEGDRRRRCRTSEQQRFKPGRSKDDEPIREIREELRIVKKRKKRKKRGTAVEAEVEDEEDDGENTPKRKKRILEKNGIIGEDGYLHHSDSEADWSDVGEDLYVTGPKKRDTISRKESLRRRQWGAGDDAATAAGRAWPVFPRHVVKKVLSTIIDEVIKHDEMKGGVFSVPVPRDEFPEYYEQIKKPMDYGTMKAKLGRGEYRSAQAMQKDFILILQNCRQFNANSSDIVKEAREQHLMRPKFLREAAKKHKLFLSEDGSVLEIVEDENSDSPQKKGRKKKKTSEVEDEENEDKGVSDVKVSKKRKKDDVDGVDVEAIVGKKKKRKKKHKESSANDGQEEMSDVDKEEVEAEATEGKKKRKMKHKDSTSTDLQEEITGVDVDENEVVEGKKKRRKAKRQDSSINDLQEDTSEVEGDTSTKKPRIRIKVKMSAAVATANSDSKLNSEYRTDAKKARKGRKSSSSKKRSDDSIVDELEEAEALSETKNLRRKKKVEGLPLRKTRGRRGSGDSIENSKQESFNDTTKDRKKKSTSLEKSLFLDLSFWKKRRESLDEGFDESRDNLTEKGPWVLPDAISDNEFAEVAARTLDKMDKHDKFSVFSEPVSEKEAPGYEDVVKNPMDFGTMRKKVKDGDYGTGSDAAAAFFEDFLLVFDNCRLYNTDESEVTEEAARILSHLPEAYVAACLHVAKQSSR